MLRKLPLLICCTLLGVADQNVLSRADKPAVERLAWSPITNVKAPFFDQFDTNWSERWQSSEAVKIIEETKTGESDGPVRTEWKFNGVWAVEEPSVYPGFRNDLGLVVKSPATHHAISKTFDKPIDPKGKTLVVQYEVKLQNGLECGGAYLKLLTQQPGASFDPKQFDDKTPYTIMFGPDKCGFNNRIHFIFRHKNPLSGVYEEKHLKTHPPAQISKLSTLYTLIVRPDNTYEILVNEEKVSSGNLLSDFTPPVNPPKEIDDPTDKKPADWVDEAKIPDQDALKPADWDESAPMYIEDLDAVKPDDWLENEEAYIDDPEGVKPADWNDEEDGAWVPNKVANPACETAAGCGPWRRPMKRNPAYKGKWTAPLIDNPEYRGAWLPRKIPNPDFFEDKTPANFEPMSAIGFELWTIQNNILFDNIYIGHDEAQAKDVAARSWALKYKIEKAQQDADEEALRQETEAEQAAGPATSLLDATLQLLVKVAEDIQANPVEGAKQHASVLAAIFAGLLVLALGVNKLLSLGSRKDKSLAKRKKQDASEPDDATVLTEKENTTLAAVNGAASPKGVRARKD